MVRRPTPTGRSLFVSGSGPVSFRFRLYFRETFPLLNDGAKSKGRSLFVSGSGPQRHIANICNRLASFLFVSAARPPLSDTALQAG